MKTRDARVDRHVGESTAAVADAGGLSRLIDVSAHGRQGTTWKSQSWRFGSVRGSSRFRVSLPNGRHAGKAAGAGLRKRGPAA